MIAMHQPCRTLGIPLVVLALLFNLLHIGTSSSLTEDLETGTDQTNETAKEKKLGKGKVEKQNSLLNIFSKFYQKTPSCHQPFIDLFKTWVSFKGTKNIIKLYERLLTFSKLF